MLKDKDNKEGSFKNIWYGLGRQRIEVPKSVLKARVVNNPLQKHLHICSMGYYPKAKEHYTYRKKGLHENLLVYCVDGHGWVQVGNQKYDVGPNEFFILPKDKEHGYGSDERRPWSIYWIHFGGDSLTALNELQAVQKQFKPSYIKNNGDITPLFSKIYSTLELGYSIDNLMFANMCLSEFLTLFIYNNRHYETSVFDKSDCVDAAILFMQEHISENISLSPLCKQFNYSVSRFSNLFKQKTGYAPIDYFVQMKMQKACQQLNFSNQPIKIIAYSLGFDDQYYFSKRFRTVIGMSPKKYRQMSSE